MKKEFLYKKTIYCLAVKLLQMHHPVYTPHLNIIDSKQYNGSTMYFKFSQLYQLSANIIQSYETNTSESAIFQYQFETTNDSIRYTCSIFTKLKLVVKLNLRLAFALVDLPGLLPLTAPMLLPQQKRLIYVIIALTY